MSNKVLYYFSSSKYLLNINKTMLRIMKLTIQSKTIYTIKIIKFGYVKIHYFRK